MSGNDKKKRMSMLDNLAAASDAPPAPKPSTASPMMTSNRALRSARDAVDSHRVWELDPVDISDDRVADRLDPSDVHDLRDAIETNGQTVPILVRRSPDNPDRYTLVYGRRRLEAIRTSAKVTKVRAIVATLDDDSALRAQISENMARRDLSFIEKALFAQELVNSGVGTQSEIAEILTVAKSAISMAITIADMVGADLVRAIGPAHGIGRPRWETLAKAIEQNQLDRGQLAELADETHSAIEIDIAVNGIMPSASPSVLAFEAVHDAVSRAAAPAPATKAPSPNPPSSHALKIDGRRGGTVKRTSKGLSIELGNGDFADWVEAEAQTLINDLHARWKARTED